MSEAPPPPCIDQALVHRLLEAQFPHWAGLPLEPVRPGGWNNKTFRLGDHLLVRLPRAQAYVAQVEKEQRWLPSLASGLPLPIPTPLGVGAPSGDYPWAWSVYGWIDGETARVAPIDPAGFGADLAAFLTALQRIDTEGGPPAGRHNFFRGGPLATYDEETRRALTTLGDRIDGDVALEVWETALASAWQTPPVWLHGDVAAGNLIVRDGRLAAVIDWGISAVGDPACDLAIAWTRLTGEGRAAFRAGVALDHATWARGRGWALWKALILCAGFSGPGHPDVAESWQVLDEVIADHRLSRGMTAEWVRRSR